MTKVYQHTFKNGDRVTMSCDFAFNPPRLSAHPFGLVNRHREEYMQWQNSVIIPDMMNHCSKEQILTIAIKELTKKTT